MRFLTDLIISSVVLLFVGQVVPGFRVPSFTIALLAAFVISLLTFFVKPVLVLLTLPITIVSLGLFTFVISAIILEIAAYFVGGFQITSFGSALLAAVLIALLSQLIRILTRSK